MQLVLGAHKFDRVIQDVDKLLLSYRNDDGSVYFDYRSTSSGSSIVPEDLAVTLLINSQAKGKAFKSILKHASSACLSQLPSKPLEATSAVERTLVASLIAQVANWPGFAASLATKVLHKRCPALIPILDNQAIFGAYMNPNWPAQKSRQDSIKDQCRIEQALEWITIDLIREENAAVWIQLKSIEPQRTLIEVFDSVWWMYFRKLEPLRAPS